MSVNRMAWDRNGSDPILPVLNDEKSKTDLLQVGQSIKIVRGRALDGSPTTWCYGRVKDVIISIVSDSISHVDINFYYRHQDTTCDCAFKTPDAHLPNELFLSMVSRRVPIEDVMETVMVADDPNDTNGAAWFCRALYFPRDQSFLRRVDSSSAGSMHLADSSSCLSSVPGASSLGTSSPDVMRDRFMIVLNLLRSSCEVRILAQEGMSLPYALELLGVVHANASGSSLLEAVDDLKELLSNANEFSAVPKTGSCGTAIRNLYSLGTDLIERFLFTGAEFAQQKVFKAEAEERAISVSNGGKLGPPIHLSQEYYSTASAHGTSNRSFCSQGAYGELMGTYIPATSHPPYNHAQAAAAQARGVAQIVPPASRSRPTVSRPKKKMPNAKKTTQKSRHSSWSEAEESLFVHLLEKYGREWKLIAEKMQMSRMKVVMFAVYYFKWQKKLGNRLPAKVIESGDSYSVQKDVDIKASAEKRQSKTKQQNSKHVKFRRLNDSDQ